MKIPRNKLPVVVFQSTLPRGERQYNDNNAYTIVAISIHAPTRGATMIKLLNSFSLLFQSTLPRGERRLSDSALALTGLFQSTLPRGERPRHRRSAGEVLPFQSTLPRGERQQFSPKSSLFSQQKLSKIFNLNNKLF